MGFRRIPFPDMPWSAGTHELERKKQGVGPLALLEFESGFRDPNWCENGHLFYVIEGRLDFELRDGNQSIGAGEACVLEPGTPHRASNPGPGPVRLFVVSSA